MGSCNFQLWIVFVVADDGVVETVTMIQRRNEIVCCRHWLMQWLPGWCP